MMMLAATFSGVLPTVWAEDWTYWRGPEYAGVSGETGLIDDWDPRGGTGSNVAWQREDLGGISTPIVMRGRLYTLVRADPGTKTEGEKVVCLDAATGRTLWEHRFNVFLSDVPDTRVGWSSVVADPETNQVYALGVCGLFMCLDAVTGEVAWQVPLHEQFGFLSTYGGRTNFPIIADDLVIISGVIIGWGEWAKPNHRFIAFDKRTGQVVWFNGTRDLPDDTTYSAPTLTTIDGQQALVVGAGDGGVWAFQAQTGNPIWQYRFSRRGLNVAPLIVGDKVYASHSEENIFGTTMGAVVALNANGSGDITESGELWRQEEIMAGKSSPLVVDDRLYIFDDRAKLHVFDCETGEKLGKVALGNTMRSSPLYADGKIYAVTAGGRWYILAPDAKRGAKKVKSGRLLKDDESIGSPICADGRIFLPTTGRLYCLTDPNLPSSGGPATTSETAAGEQASRQPGSGPPTHLQLVPCEVLMRPGQTQQFTARLFNEKGEWLRDVAATFQLNGKGEVDDQGRFSATADAAQSATTVTATAEGIRGTARVRIVPDLPWEFDFEQIPISPVVKSGEPPIVWVGCRYRHVIRDVNGNKVMVKVTTIPKGTRSQGWFGHSDFENYTIEADVMGSEVGGRMPDIGLIAQGYAIDLQGANQQLQIRSWVPQLRMATTIDHAWKPNVWYTMKLRGELDGEIAVLKGKVWPRGESEPTAWTIEARDESPNLSGSPGLYGNAKDAEIFFDNIRVYHNSGADGNSDARSNK